ncbi:MAG TPA: outer membrane beta-barrel protein [Steroidobacteraceae bacterium]|nr:outer membrane beta-barrel protein [Steroidobacteraceae bacterium]
MKKTLALIGAGIGALVATAAMAADYGYGGAGYSGPYLGVSAGQLYYNEQGLAQMSPTILMFRGGEQFSPYLAAEGRIGTNVSGGSAFGYHINAQAIYAGYVKGILPFSPLISGYVLAGLGGAQWHRNYPDYNSNDIGLSFGVGAEFNLSSAASVDVEWARLTSGSNDHDRYGYSANQLTFGVNWRF